MKRAINMVQKRGGSTSFGVTIKERTFAAQHTRYQFNGKEYDSETETTYMDARNSDGDLGVMETLDSYMKDYPNLSGYNGFGNNPLLIVDLDGNRLKVTNKEFRESVQNYINNVLGVENGFSFKGKLLKVDKDYLDKLMSDESASQDKKDLAQGLVKIIKDKKITINVSISESDFFFRKEKVLSYTDSPVDDNNDGIQDLDSDGNPKTRKVPHEIREIGNKKGELTKTSILFYDKSYDSNNAYLILNKEDANSQIEGVDGNESSTFFHEILDHGLDVVKNKSVSDSGKTKKEKVEFENKARREQKISERDGSEHD